MRLHTHLRAIAAGLLTCLCSLSVSLICTAGEIPVPQGAPDTNSNASNTNTSPATVAVEEALRQLKEQQASAARALELILDHTETALHRNAITVSNQLSQFSLALADYSDRQFQLMRSTESRTLQVTLLILLLVVLTAAALLLLAARALRSLTHRFSGTAAAFGLEPAPVPQALIDQAAESAYTAAILDVEKRIAALEQRPVPVPAAAIEAAAAQPAAQAGPRSASSTKFRSSAPLALALGSGEALMFLPRDRPPQGDKPSVGVLGRIGRFFQRSAPAPKYPKG
jgi:hypothetical protein